MTAEYEISETVREKLKQLCILDKHLKKLVGTTKFMQQYLEEVGLQIQQFTPETVLVYRLAERNMLLVDEPIQPFTEAYLYFMLEVEEQEKRKQLCVIIQEEIDDLQIDILSGIYGHDTTDN